MSPIVQHTKPKNTYPVQNNPGVIIGHNFEAFVPDDESGVFREERIALQFYWEAHTHTLIINYQLLITHTHTPIINY